MTNKYCLASNFSSLGNKGSLVNGVAVDLGLPDALTQAARMADISGINVLVWSFLTEVTSAADGDAKAARDKALKELTNDDPPEFIEEIADVYEAFCNAGLDSPVTRAAIKRLVNAYDEWLD